MTAFLLALAILSAQTATLSGALPRGVDGSIRAVWIDASAEEPIACRVDAGRWSCSIPSPDSHGIVIVIAGDRVFVVAARGIDGADPLPLSWGRVIRVMPGGAAAADLHDLTLSAWRPERSSVRPQLRRFRATRDDAVVALKLSDTAFWVGAVGTVDADAFLSLDGPDIGSVRISTRQLSHDVPESPLITTAPLPETMTGRVQNARGEDVAAATIDLFQPLQIDRDPRDLLTSGVAVVARGSAISRADGVFVFDHLPEPPFLVVTSAADGRASDWITSLGPPIVIGLTPPLVARGRVVRHGIPIAGARVHFVPTLDAWASSVDPAEHLAEEVVAGDDGRFMLALPEHHTGAIQAVSSDGAAARVPIADSSSPHSRELSLGDISVPEPRRVVVRLLEPPQSARCDLIAAGPLGNLGLQIVRSSSAVNVYTLDLPETGRWVLSAECGGTPRELVPTIATIPAAEPDGIVGIVAIGATIDVRFAR